MEVDSRCGALDNALQPVYAVVERSGRQSGFLPLVIVLRDDYNIRSYRSFNTLKSANKVIA
jgi:hypothetical protein